MRKSLIVVSLFIMSVLVITGCGKKSTATKVPDKVKVVMNNVDKIDISYSFTQKNDVILRVKNNEEVELYIALFDKNNKLVRTEQRHLFSNGDSNLKLYISGISGEKATITKVYISSKVTENKDMKYTHEENKIKTSYYVNPKTNKLSTTITNESGKILDVVSYSVVFYKNNTIVDLVNNMAQNVDVTKQQEIYMPIDTNSKKEVKTIDYDRIEIKVDNAIKYQN